MDKPHQAQSNPKPRDIQLGRSMNVALAWRFAASARLRRYVELPDTLRP